MLQTKASSPCVSEGVSLDRRSELLQTGTCALSIPDVLADAGLDLPKVSVQTSALYLDPVGISTDEGDEMPDFGGMFAMEITSGEELVKALRELGVEKLGVEVNVSMGISECVGATRRNRWDVGVETKYKRKDKKVRPANVPMPGGENPGGDFMQEVDNLDSTMSSTEHGRKTVPQDLV